MWNFTGRAAIIPNLEGIEDLLSRKETAFMSQMDIASLKVENLFLGRHSMNTFIDIHVSIYLVYAMFYEYRATYTLLYTDALHNLVCIRANY